MHSSPVARLNQELGIAAEEVLRHPDLRPVRNHQLRVGPESLDEAENVVPAPTVKAWRKDCRSRGKFQQLLM
jgi:hypothetical protein